MEGTLFTELTLSEEASLVGGCRGKNRFNGGNDGNANGGDSGGGGGNSGGSSNGGSGGTDGAG